MNLHQLLVAQRAGRIQREILPSHHFPGPDHSVEARASARLLDRLTGFARGSGFDQVRS